jgi:hypothetical protein
VCVDLCLCVCVLIFAVVVEKVYSTVYGKLHFLAACVVTIWTPQSII